MNDQVKRNKIVYLDLTIKNAAGEILETTQDAGEFSYLHGRGNLLPALENVLEGQRPGFSTSLTLAPEAAFGEYQEDLLVRVPTASLNPDVPQKIGEAVQFQGPDGMAILVIKSIDDTEAVLDGNHPLAGQTLQFELTIKAVRDAHKDEVKHRRPHPAGHHLMVSDSSVEDLD